MQVNIDVTPAPANGRCAPLTIVTDELPTLRTLAHECGDELCDEPRGHWAVLYVRVSEQEAARLLAIGVN